MMAMMRRNAALVALCYLVCAISKTTRSAASVVKLPKGFIACKKDDPGVNTCIQQALQTAVPHLVKGIPSLGLIPIDPLIISQMDINQGVSNGPLDIKLSFKDLYIHNIGSIKITSMKSNINNHTFNLKADFDEPLVLEGMYNIQGKIIILPIRGEGKSNLTLAALKVSIDINGKPVTRRGEEYMELESLDLKFSTSRLYIQLDNLFNGDQLLGNNMNMFMNQNWREILKDLQPAFESALGMAFQSVAHQFFYKVPYGKIFN
ncbi:PREDICTED: protein takeout-like [Diuraphis noxia]|uniref:protein takeout-like n=1 Tax=Diuraphis noxia TaxID=143948 RepID=UPI000763801B|nr:PREDICTED: protein takeout-like [Diuraphis noxia]